jgi:hypothetical protein
MTIVFAQLQRFALKRNAGPACHSGTTVTISHIVASSCVPRSAAVRALAGAAQQSPVLVWTNIADERGSPLPGHQ